MLSIQLADTIKYLEILEEESLRILTRNGK
jgi:hypothetical protein